MFSTPIAADKTLIELTDNLSVNQAKKHHFQAQLEQQSEPAYDGELIVGLDELCEDTWELFEEAQEYDVALAKKAFQLSNELQALLVKACQNGLIAASQLSSPKRLLVIYMNALIHTAAIYQINLFPTTSDALSQVKIDSEKYIEQWNDFYKTNENVAKQIQSIAHFNDQLEQLNDLQQAIAHINFAHAQLESKQDFSDYTVVESIQTTLNKATFFDDKCNNGHFSQRIAKLAVQAYYAEFDFLQFNRISFSQVNHSHRVKYLLIFDVDETLAFISKITKQRVIIEPVKLYELLSQIDLEECVLLALTARYYPELPTVRFLVCELLRDIQNEIKKEVFDAILYTSSQSKGIALENEFQRLRKRYPYLTKENTVLIDNLQSNLDDVENHGFKGILADFKGSHYDAVHQFFNIPKRQPLRDISNTMLNQSSSAPIGQSSITPPRTP